MRREGGRGVRRDVELSKYARSFLCRLNYLLPLSRSSFLPSLPLSLPLCKGIPVEHKFVLVRKAIRRLPSLQPSLSPSPRCPLFQVTCLLLPRRLQLGGFCLADAGGGV